MWLAYFKERNFLLKETNCTGSRNQKPMCPSQAPRVTQKPELTEEWKRGALSIPKQRSACKSAMESGRSLMRGEPVSSRQCGRICVSTRKASDREQLLHPDTTSTFCPHRPQCLQTVFVVFNTLLGI